MDKFETNLIIGVTTTTILLILFFVLIYLPHKENIKQKKIKPKEDKNLIGTSTYKAKFYLPGEQTIEITGLTPEECISIKKLFCNKGSNSTILNGNFENSDLTKQRYQIDLQQVYYIRYIKEN